MLNKQICKKCVNERLPSFNWFITSTTDLDYNTLYRGKLFISDWEGGIVNCNKGVVICVDSWNEAKVKNGPPKHCCYLLEQFLHHDATKKKKTHAK